MDTRTSWPTSRDNDRLGTVLGGDYALDSVVARDEELTTYTGHHVRTGRKVVVKMMDGHHCSEEARWRFLRCSESLNRVFHPSLPETLDYSVTGDGTPYHVMEETAGDSLSVFMQSWSSGLPLQTALHVGIQIADALCSAHTAGAVHGSLNSREVFIRDTRCGLFVKVAGTSPSDCEERRDELAQSDVFQAASLMYYLLTGEEVDHQLSLCPEAAQGTAGHPLAFRMNRAGVPALLMRTISRALSPRPEERLVTMASLLRLLKLSRLVAKTAR